MKYNINKFILSVIFILNVFCPELKAQWFLPTTEAAGGNDIQFLDEYTGWLAGNSGIIKKSTNGGANWVAQTSNTTQSLYRVKMLNANTGYVCGDGGVILKTTNSGTNWIVQTSGTSLLLYGLDIYNTSTVICTGANRIQVKTTNGGLNWTAVSMNGVVSNSNVKGIEIIDNSTIFICTSESSGSGKVYKSTDGGINYYTVLGSLITNSTLNDVKFVSSQKGFVCGNYGKIYRTSNGGISWDTIKISEPFNNFTGNKLSFVDENYGIASGNSYAYTTNGGNNWNALKVSVQGINNLTYNGVSFLNYSKVFMISTNRIAKTTNGGGATEWIRNYEGNEGRYDYGKSIVTDAAGNVIVTGNTNAEFNGDYSDGVTIKYNSAGTKLWEAVYAESMFTTCRLNSIASDASGNVFVAGYANGDFLIIKYNSAGVQQWLQKYNGPQNLNDEAVSIKVDGSGNVYVTGKSAHDSSSSQLNDYATVKYNSSGVQQWIKRYSGISLSDNVPVSMALDGSGNIFVTGKSGSPFALDFATIKYNSSGVQQWVKRYNGIGNADDYPSAMTTDNSGNVIVTGSSVSTAGNYDFTTIKYNSSGVMQWNKSYNGTANFGAQDYAKAIISDASGNIFVTGGGSELVSGCDFVTIKYNSSGTEQWTKKYYGSLNLGSSSLEDMPTCIALNSAGEIFVTGTGYFSNDVQRDILTIKYSANGNLVWSENYNTGQYLSISNAISISSDSNIYICGDDDQNDDVFLIKYSANRIYPKLLQLSFLTEGFYNENNGISVVDTVKVLLRNTFSPYNVIDSLSGIYSSAGNISLSFQNAVNGTNYYLVIRHRNSIETWNSSGITFSSNSAVYDFTSSQSTAYGNNLKLKGSKYCIFSGDVNQDGTIDASDLSQVENDAANSVGGYVTNDLNGDNFVDASDVSIVDNNSANSVMAITP